MSDVKYPKGKSPNAVKNHFKPGQVANPKGGPKHSYEILAMRNLMRVGVHDKIVKLFEMSLTTLQDHMKHPDTPTIEVIFGSFMIEALKKNDVDKMTFLLNYTMGKLPEAPRVTVEGDMNVQNNTTNNLSIHKQIVDHIQEIKAAKQIEHKG